MRKVQIFCYLVILFIFMFVFPLTIYGIDDGSIHKKRVVTLVYDDSGSMRTTTDSQGKKIQTDNWKFANYSLQSLIGLLGENDELSVVRMSNPQKINPISLSYLTRQNEIERIIHWNESGSTPFETVLTSIDFMKSEIQSDPNRDFWFIIVMDGLFNDFENGTDQEIQQKYQMIEDVLLEFNHFAYEKGVKVNSILVTIESFLSEKDLKQIQKISNIWSKTTRGIHLTAKSEKEIIDRINEVAALITERDINTEQSSINLNPSFDRKNVSLTSPFPLRRLTILHQSSANQITWNIDKFEVMNQGTEYSSDGPFYMVTPKDPYKLRKDIYGSIAHLSSTDKERVIPEGQYIIQFNETFNNDEQKEFQFIAEAALDFEIFLHRLENSGSWNSAEEVFFPGSEMIIQVDLLSADRSRKKIQLKDEEMIKEIEVTAVIDGAQINLQWDKEKQSFIGKFIMPQEQTEINITTIVPGYYRETKTVAVKGVRDRILNLINLSNHWSYPVDTINDAEPIKVQPMINGHPITSEELSEIFPNIKLSSNNNINYEINQNGNIIEISPKKGLLPAFTPVGEMEFLLIMEGKYNGEYAELLITYTIEDISFWEKIGKWIVLLIIIILILIYLIGIWKKPRFAKNSMYILMKISDIHQGRVFGTRESTEYFHTNFFTRWFFPYRAERIAIGNLLLKATEDGEKIILLKECQRPDMKVQHTPLEETSGKEDIYLYVYDEVEIDFHSRKETYIVMKA